MRAIHVIVLGAAVVVATAARAEEGPLLIRVRAVYLVPANRSDAIPALSVPSDAIHVSNRLLPELDVSFFILRNLAVELILSYPQKHDVTLSGTGIGTATHLPPTLTAQWHFLPDFILNPYLGAGVNVTFFTSTNLSVPGVGKLDLSSPSVGPAAQVGVDVKLAEHWYVNLDVKYVFLRSDVQTGGNKVSAVQVDPWLLGGGVGFRL